MVAAVDMTTHLSIQQLINIVSYFKHRCPNRLYAALQRTTVLQTKLLRNIILKYKLDNDLHRTISQSYAT